MLKGEGNRLNILSIVLFCDFLACKDVFSTVASELQSISPRTAANNSNNLIFNIWLYIIICMINKQQVHYGKQ